MTTSRSDVRLEGLELPCLCVMVGPEGAIVDANPFSVALGFVAGGALPRHITRDGLDEALAHGQPRTTEANLGGRHYLLRWSPVAFNRCLLTGIDLSEAPQPLDDGASTDSLHELRRRHAVRQVTHCLGHDFNNLLTGMMGYIELLSIRLDQQCEEHHFVKMLHKSVGQASALAGRLLEQARHTSAPTEVDLHEQIRRACRLAGPDTTVDLQLKAPHSRCSGEAERLLACFAELVANARQAMPRGGSLTVCTHNINRPDGTTDIEIAFHDTGRGMNKASAGRAFDPFYCGWPGGGTGLGLTCAARCLRAHDGGIELDSHPGQGTSVRLRLPVAVPSEARAQVPAATRPPLTTVPAGGARVAVVDDEKVARDTARLMLEDLGHSVTCFEDGPAALEHIGSRPGEVDLVLLDVRMPEMNGEEVFEALMSFETMPRVLFVTGYSGDVDLDALVRRGACGILDKPYTLDQLRQQVDRALAIGARR